MTKEPQEGYVYILTNPSFKEDWVKIGYCPQKCVKIVCAKIYFF